MTTKVHPRIKGETPSQRYLKENFRYNPATGDFVRISNNRAQTKSSVEITSNGFMVRYKLTLLIWKYVYGCNPDRRIMFIDKNKQNTKLKNLTDKEIFSAKSRQQAMAIRKKGGRHEI